MHTSLSERLKFSIARTAASQDEGRDSTSQVDLDIRQTAPDTWRVVLVVSRPQAVTLEIELNGEEPQWFRSTLENLATLLRLPTNWNSYGAPPIDPDLAIAGLRLLAATMEDDTPPPVVVPTHRGAIQFEWHMRGLDLEVNVLALDRFAVGYEDLQQSIEWERELSDDLRPLRTALAELTRRS
jgi:hypothetical protein